MTTICLLPPTNEVCEGYVFTGVSLSTWGGMCGCSRGACVVAPGGHAWLLRGSMHGCSGGACVVAPGRGVVAPRGGMHGCSGGHAWLLQGGHVWLLPGGMCGCSWGGTCVVALGGHAWDTTTYGDMINERAVRILLECILVAWCFYIFCRHVWTVILVTMQPSTGDIKSPCLCHQVRTDTQDPDNFCA